WLAARAVAAVAGLAHVGAVRHGGGRRGPSALSVARRAETAEAVVGGDARRAAGPWILAEGVALKAAVVAGVAHLGGELPRDVRALLVAHQAVWSARVHDAMRDAGWRAGVG